MSSRIQRAVDRRHPHAGGLGVDLAVVICLVAPAGAAKVCDASWDALAKGATIVVASGQLATLQCRRTNIDPSRCSSTTPLYFFAADKVTTWKSLLNTNRAHKSKELLDPMTWEFLNGLHGAVLLYDRASANADKSASDSRCTTELCEIETQHVIDSS